jgi:hypothetical protein
VEDCARALGELLDPDQRRMLAEKGSARVTAEFTNERIAERFWEAFQEVMSTRGTASQSRFA